MDKKIKSRHHSNIKRVESQNLIYELSTTHSIPENMIINQALEIGLPILKEKLLLVKKALEQENVLEPSASEINLKFHELYEVEKITADISKGQTEIYKKLDNMDLILQAIVDNQQMLNVKTAITQKLAGATYQALIIISNGSASLIRLGDDVKNVIENQLPDRIEKQQAKMIQNIKKNNTK